MMVSSVLRWNLMSSLRKGTEALVQKLDNPPILPTTTQCSRNHACQIINDVGMGVGWGYMFCVSSCCVPEMLRAAPVGTHLHPSMLEEPAGSIHGALYVLDNFGRFIHTQACQMKALFSRKWLVNIALPRNTRCLLAMETSKHWHYYTWRYLKLTNMMDSVNLASSLQFWINT